MLAVSAGRWPARLVGWLGCCLIGLLPSLAFAQDNADRGLTVRMKQRLEQELAPAFFDGNAAVVLGICVDLIQSVDANRWDAVDDQLQQLGLPDLGQLLLSTRLELRSSDSAVAVPAITPMELQRVLPALEDQLQRIAGDVEAATKLQVDGLNVTEFADFERRLWQLHVLHNEWHNTATLIEYGQQLASSRGGRSFQKQRGQAANRQTAPDDRDSHADSGPPAATPEQQLDALSVRARDLGQRIEETSMRVRLERLDYALQQVRGTPPLVQRIKAAWAGDFDGYALNQYFVEHPEAARRLEPRLRDPNLEEATREKVNQLEQILGSELLVKSRHLFTGLHWWLRGRYGMGTHGFGMLKPPHAWKHPQSLFGLYMPVETPVPTAPSVSPPIPEIDRRHHYAWMFEYRRLGVGLSVTRQTTGKSDRRVTSKTKLSRFY